MSAEKHTLEIIVRDIQTVNAKIEIVEKYEAELRQIHQTAFDELTFLRAQKKSLLALAKQITDLP